MRSAANRRRMRHLATVMQKIALFRQCLWFALTCNTVQRVSETPPKKLLHKGVNCVNININPNADKTQETGVRGHRIL